MNEETTIKHTLSTEEINKCIAVLEQLNAATFQIFEIPKSQRIALIKAAGQFSRPDREEFSRRKKDAKALAKKKEETRDRVARKETGIRSAREASIFVAPKLLASHLLLEKELLELKIPKICYVCKSKFTKCIIFTIRCAAIVAILIMPNVFKRQMYTVKWR